jgi:hypothetical protein
MSMPNANFFGLMREAVRRVELVHSGALLFAVGSLAEVEVPKDYGFVFSLPQELVSINFQGGTWGPIGPPPLKVYNSLRNDLLRVEIDVVRAVELVRQAGYADPIVFGSLNQPLGFPQAPNPFHFFFTPGSQTIIQVDAVTGDVTIS